MYFKLGEGKIKKIIEAKNALVLIDVGENEEIIGVEVILDENTVKKLKMRQKLYR